MAENRGDAPPRVGHEGRPYAGDSRSTRNVAHKVRRYDGFARRYRHGALNHPARLEGSPGGLGVDRLVARMGYWAPSARFQFAMFQYENS